MYAIYFTLLYQPLFNALVLIYQSIAFHDLGVAIVLFTIAIRLVLFPVFHRTAKLQAALQKMKPDLDRIKETHKGNIEKQAEAQMALYREHGVNPFADMGFTLIQFPILLALFDISRKITDPNVFSALYGFIPAPEAFTASFLGLINLADPSIVVVALAAIIQFLQAWVTMPKGGNSWLMAVIAPAIIFFFFRNLPAVMSLYLIVMAVASIIQHFVILKTTPHGQPGIRQ